MPSKNTLTDRSRCVRWKSPDITQKQREILRDAGQDPSVVPDEPFRFLALPEVRARFSLSTSSIYRAMAAGKFPRPVSLDHLTRASAAAA
jgi:predicted DNA-binding transcriptional regulator AlpA